MKVHKLFCLDIDIAERLKRDEDNQSAFVNSLIRTHYNNMNVKSMTTNELKLKSKELKLKSEYDKKLKEIRYGTT